jgi:hypothetical protein
MLVVCRTEDRRGLLVQFKNRNADRDEQEKMKELLLQRIAGVMTNDEIDVISKTIVIENLLIESGYLPREVKENNGSAA